MGTPTAYTRYIPLYRTESNRLVVTAHAKSDDAYWGRLAIDVAEGTWELITKDETTISYGVWIGDISGAAFIRFLKSVRTLTRISRSITTK
jgi:hypothetical protein